MLLRIIHRTRFEYDQPAQDSHNELRLRPLKRPKSLANGSVVYEDGEEEDGEGEEVVSRKGNTVEDKVKGLAEKILKDDERKREEDLVSFPRFRMREAFLMRKCPRAEAI